MTVRTLLIDALPALSVNLMVCDLDPSASADCTSVVVVNPGVSETELAPLATPAITGDVNDCPPTNNSAVPPAVPTSPTTTDAVTVKFVFSPFRAFATWFRPPEAVRANAVGAVGGVVSTVNVVVPEAVAAFPAMSGAVTDTVTVPSFPDATACVK